MHLFIKKTKIIKKEKLHEKSYILFDNVTDDAGYAAV